MNKVNEIITDRIINALENDIVPWRKPWQSKLPCNFVSGKTYKGVNLFLLALQPYSSSYWLTFKQAKEKGAKVMKGERSTQIVFWKISVYKDKDGTEKKVPMLRYYNVFNVEQCEGLEIPTEAERPDFKPIEEAEKLAKSYLERESIKLEKATEAFYVPVRDVIAMPSKQSFMKPEYYYSVLFHEIGHSTGHDSRLKRGLTGNFGSEPYAKEELIAEMTSAFACASLGIDNTVIDNSTAYIKGWLKKLKSDPSMVVSAAAKASKAFDLIVTEKVEA
jgi:antirestriction protein ArdC